MCLTVFQVPLNFDTEKEILKIQCQIPVLMKKTIILRNIQAAMRTFIPPEQKKMCGKSHEKETTDVVCGYSSK